VGENATEDFGLILSTPRSSENLVDLKVAGRVRLPSDAGEAPIARIGGPDGPNGISAIARTTGQLGVDCLAKAFAKIPLVLVLVGFQVPCDVLIE
jgi:hypothetical protein